MATWSKASVPLLLQHSIAQQKQTHEAVLMTAVSEVNKKTGKQVQDQ